MAIMITHSDLTPASEIDKQNMYLYQSIPDEDENGITYDSNKILQGVNDKVHATLSSVENTKLTEHGIMNLKRNLAMIPHVASIGVSVVNDMAEVILKLLLNDVESWISAKFSVVPHQPPVNPPAEPVAPTPPEPAPNAE